MKKILIPLILLAIGGCNHVGTTSENQLQQPSKDCPENPSIPLDNLQVKPLVLGEQTILESGMVKQAKSLGYSFQGEAGKQLNYQTNQDICFWIYTPDGKLLRERILPKTGAYTLQVTAAKGATTFDLKMSLGDVTLSQKTSKLSQNPSKQQDIQLVYNVARTPNLKPSPRLKSIVNQLRSLANRKGMSPEALSITLIDVNSGEFAEYQQEKLRYPASVAKLFWMVILYSQLQKGILPDEQAFTKDLEKMVVRSDNEATSHIIDEITDTTSGSELKGKEFQLWLNKRYQLNSFFEAADYGTLNISQKTFPIPREKLYQPQGRERQMRGDPENPTRNKVTTEQVARLMYEIVTGKALSPEYSQKMQQWLHKDLTLELWQQLDPNQGEFNPVRTFFGESLPKDVYFLSKAGWTSQTRQEVAYINSNGGQTAYILAIFAEDKAYAQDGKIFPMMSRLVFERMGGQGEITESTQAKTTPLLATGQNLSSLSPQASTASPSLGWLRIGAVNSDSGEIKVGTPLIETTQPVTISSARVPTIGEQVTLTKKVNLRQEAPQPPTYQLVAKIGAFQPGQKLVVHNLTVVPDSSSNPPYKSVWVQVGMP